MIEAEKFLLDFGKKIWPYIQAEKEMKQKFLTEETETFLFLLPADLSAKWSDFESQGGSLHNFRQGERFEDFFTPEEHQLIDDALLKAEEVIQGRIRLAVANERKEEFEVLVFKYQQELEKIEKKISELEDLGKMADKWQVEIKEEVKFFQRSLAEMEARPTVEAIQEKIEQYS